jgi:hypothetical protein
MSLYRVINEGLFNFKNKKEEEKEVVIELSNAEKKKYLILYDSFVKFVKNPSSSNLNNNFWSASISDICYIIGISSDKFNEVIAKNHPTGKKINIVDYVIKHDEEDYEYFKKQFSELGNCILLEAISPNIKMTLFSLAKNKMYYCNMEHDELGEFPKAFGYHCNEFEDIINGTYDYNSSNEIKEAKAKLSAIRKLYKEYDAEKNYGIFNLLTE